MADTFKFATDEVKKQRDQFKGDAKELAMGEALDADDGGALGSASTTAKGGSLPGKGKSFKA